MREIAIKNIGILKWILLTGILIILIGFSFFLGIFEIDFEYSLIGAPTNSLYGITYLALYAFGFYLVLIALLFILPILDESSRKGLKNYQYFFVSFGILGLGLILYSLSIKIGILPTLVFNHTWFDYFVIGTMVLISSNFVLIFSTVNFQELSQFNLLWIILIFMGIIIEGLSLLAYWSLLLVLGISPQAWGDLFFLGIPFLILGGLPFLLSYKPKDQRISIGLGILSVVLIFSGLLTYLAPSLALNNVVFPLSIFKYNRYFDYLFFGSLLLIMGTSLASSIELAHMLLRKLLSLWMVFLILGFLQYLIALLMEITDTHFIDLGLDFLFLQSTRGSLLFGMTWDIFLFNGLITTLPVLIILGSLILQETRLENSDQGTK